MTAVPARGPVASSIRPTLADAADVFLAGTEAVRAAVASDLVGAAWDEPSVLEDQRVGGLAGHLARGGAWIVGEYLDLGPPTEPVAFEDAGDYFARLVQQLDAAGHQAIRDRGVALAAPGQAALVAELEARLDGIAARLAALDEDATMSAYAGLAMRVRDYLVTRIVEQVVHLDDLARSVAGTGWDVPRAGVDLAMAVAVDVARRRQGDPAVVRALYRDGAAAGVFPAL